MDPSDKRFFLLNLLENYKGFDGREENYRLRTIKFVNDYKDCFERHLEYGHITGSAFVVDTKLSKTLLTHHAKLNIWAQLGGHSDGDPNPLNVALKEAVEESGLKEITFFANKMGIFDIDIHIFPEKSNFPSHYHFDIRSILVANDNENITTNHESIDLKWINLVEVNKYNSDESVLRMVRKLTQK